MTINSNILKITGNAELAYPLVLGNEYKIELTTQVRSTTIKDNDDGTSDQVFQTRLLTATVLTDNGKIETKDKRKRSQKMRNSLHFLWQEEGEPGTFEDFYDRSMSILNSNLPEIYQQYVKNKGI